MSALHAAVDLFEILHDESVMPKSLDQDRAEGVVIGIDRMLASLGLDYAEFADALADPILTSAMVAASVMGIPSKLRLFSKQRQELLNATTVHYMHGLIIGVIYERERRAQDEPAPS